MPVWTMELLENIKSGDTKTYTSWEMPDEGMGLGLNDVPAWVAGTLDQHRRWQNQELPIRGAVNLESSARVTTRANWAR
jgi:hypothetical protein